jgi:hypothetical protein
MTTRPTAVLAALAALAAAPAAAHAATARADRACYLQSIQARVSVTGTGFTPGRPFHVEIGGELVEGSEGTVDDAGVARTSFVPPAVGRTRREKGFTATVVQDDITADVSFSVTRFLADFTPEEGKPATLRVRFSAFGFGLLQAHPLQPAPRSVYVHYVDPSGQVHRTARLGRTAGPCGHVLRTDRRRLFPFKARPGEWTLQFDTSPHYRRGTGTSTFLYYTRGIRIRR